LLFPGSGRGYFLDRTTAVFCPFSPVEGSSFYLRVAISGSQALVSRLDET
jgi:hypothetical protein